MVLNVSLTPGGNSACDLSVRNFVNDHGSGADDTIVTNSLERQDVCYHPNMGVITNLRPPPVALFGERWP